MNKKKLLLNKNYVINELLIKEIINQNLNVQEFLLIIYFFNNNGGKLDVQTISDNLYLKEEDIMIALNSLVEKKLISIVSNKDENGKLSDYINIDGITDSIENNVSKDSKSDIFSQFEKEFGRTISSMEYEIINEWIDSGFKEELIIAALKEAVYNGVTNLRYIDKILFEWKKNGVDTVKDIEVKQKKYKEGKKSTNSLYDYDWITNDDETK